MAVYDVAFWQRNLSSRLLEMLQLYRFRAIVITPPLKAKLIEFFRTNAAGVIITDMPSEVPKVIASKVFIVAVADDDEVEAEFVIRRREVENGVPRGLMKKLASFIAKASRISVLELEEELEDEIELSGNEKLLYETLRSNPQGLSQRMLCSMLGWKGSQLRVYVHRLRNKGIPVVFSAGKYYLESRTEERRAETKA